MSKLIANISDGQRMEVYLKSGDVREGDFRRWTQTEAGDYLTLKCDEFMKNGQVCKEFWFMREEEIKLIHLQMRQ